MKLAEDLLVAAKSGEDTSAFVAALADVDPAALTPPERLAFWLDVYNARVKTATVGMSGDLRTKRGFFKDTAYVVGGRRISLHEMEHGVLRGNRRPPYSPFRPLGGGDPRLAWIVELDPRIHFALNCGAHSCPPIRAYTAERIDPQLTLATRAYLDGEVVVTGQTLTLPYLCSLYANDFADVRAFVAAHLDDTRAEWIRKNPRAKVTYGAYRWEIV